MALIGVAYAMLAVLGVASAWVLLPVPFVLLLSAFLIVYIGCHRSLDKEDAESLTSKDAYMFPVVGSCVLFSLYIAFKLLGKYYVNLLLSGYFFLIGVAVLTATLAPPLHLLDPKAKLVVDKTFNVPWVLKFLFEKPTVQLKFTAYDLIALVASIAFGVWYLWTRHWIANNIFAVALCIQGLESVSLGSFKVGAILLCGLFVYDVFWVFGTDVMVTVATSFDAPIKLLFPRSWATLADEAQFSLLGLGDIVLPGAFLALMLRIDEHLTGKRQMSNTTFPKPYFNTGIVAYTLGVMCAIVVMYKFGVAQPVLLYLSPACLGAALATAVARGEFGMLWAYGDSQPTASTTTAADTKPKAE